MLTDPSDYQFTSSIYSVLIYRPEGGYTLYYLKTPWNFKMASANILVSFTVDTHK